MRRTRRTKPIRASFHHRFWRQLVRHRQQRCEAWDAVGRYRLEQAWDVTIVRSVDGRLQRERLGGRCVLWEGTRRIRFVS